MLEKRREEDLLRRACPSELPLLGVGRLDLAPVPDQVQRVLEFPLLLPFALGAAGFFHLRGEGLPVHARLRREP